MDFELYLDLFYMMAFVKEVNLDFLFLIQFLLHFEYFDLGSIFFFLFILFIFLLEKMENLDSFVDEMEYSFGF
jgi:hypothetical protein